VVLRGHIVATCAGQAVSRGGQAVRWAGQDVARFGGQNVPSSGQVVLTSRQFVGVVGVAVICVPWARMTSGSGVASSDTSDAAALAGSAPWPSTRSSAVFSV
jgi:hypothetical protein